MPVVGIRRGSRSPIMSSSVFDRPWSKRSDAWEPVAEERWLRMSLIALGAQQRCAGHLSPARRKRSVSRFLPLHGPRLLKGVALGVTLPHCWPGQFLPDTSRRPRNNTKWVCSYSKSNVSRSRDRMPSSSSMPSCREICFAIASVNSVRPLSDRAPLCQASRLTKSAESEVSAHHRHPLAAGVWVAPASEKHRQGRPTGGCRGAWPALLT